MKNLYSLFLSQAYRDCWDDYNRSLKLKNFPKWDYVILTASNEQQAEGFRKQIEERRAFLPKETTFVAIPDRDGKRVGSGGATLEVLKYLHEQEESFDGLRILVIHSGGDSKRVPQYSALGKGFFQHLDHEWIIRFIGSRIKDPNIIRLVRRMLKAGIMNNYELEETEEGSGQGSVCSPVISCIYMHYVLVWCFKEVITPKLKGNAGLVVVYADDCAPRRRKLVT